MATLTVAAAARAGVEVVAGAAACAAAGDTFANTGQEIAIFTNASVAPINVTFATPGTHDGQAISSRVVAVGASETCAIGPFPPGVYSTDSAGMVIMTYGTETDLKVKILKVTPA